VPSFDAGEAPRRSTSSLDDVDIFAAIDAAFRRSFEHPFDALSTLEKVLVAVSGLEADVNNGGFHQYYFNSSGDTANLAPKALRTIGAVHMASIVEAANSRFGPGGPPNSRLPRQNALFELSDDLWDDLNNQFYKYPDDISTLLERYFKSRVTV